MKINSFFLVHSSTPQSYESILMKSFPNAFFVIKKIPSSYFHAN